MSGIFMAWRTNGLPTIRPPNPTAVTADVLEFGFVFAFLLLAFCFILIIPGYRGVSRLYFTIRMIVSLFIGSAIFLAVLGQDWEDAEIESLTPYKAFASTEIHAKIGMKIGLASVNITLLGTPRQQMVGTHENQVLETINYNERFYWNWRQGRGGFGPFAGRIARMYRAAQFRGLPLPILWIAEYFVLDGELIRWGRSYRTAGWFTNEVLWTAAPTWVIANILSFMVLYYCGLLFVLTGTLMLVSNIIWASIKWGTQPLVIPFEDGALETHYGASFYLCLSGGIISIVYGLIIIVMDHWYPQKIADFFGNDVLQDADQYYHQVDEPEDKAGDAEGRGSHRYGGVQKKAARGTVLGRLRPTTRRRPRPDSGGLSSTASKSVYEQNGASSTYGNGAYEEERVVEEVGEQPANDPPPPQEEKHETSAM